MKNYTDIEQSNKLKEILPVESADMFYLSDGKVKLMWEHLKNIPLTAPCWSLAALLDVIPKEVKIKGQKYAPCLFPIANDHWLYKLWYNSNEIIESPIAIWCDNPVDACYEMIIELYKRKIL